MDQVLKTIAVLLASVGWGGVVLMSFLIMPARMMIPNVEPEAADTVSKYFHRLFSFAQAPLYLLTLIVIVLGDGDRTVILPAVFLLVLSVLDVALLERSLMTMQKPSLSPEERAANQGAVKQLQYAQMASDVFKIILGGILLVMLVNFGDIV